MIPQPWTFALLALAAYRLTRLLGWDVITRSAREALIGRYEEGSGKKARDTERGKKLGRYHRKLDEFAHCPFALASGVRSRSGSSGRRGRIGRSSRRHRSP